MTKAFNSYIGKAGHLAVMAEFLLRGWNAERIKGFSGQFQIPIKQLRNIRDVLVHYVLIVRHKDKWTTPIIIPQDILLDYFENNDLGSEHEGYINLYFSYSGDKVECSGLNMTKHVGDYSDFPILAH